MQFMRRFLFFGFNAICEEIAFGVVFKTRIKVEDSEVLRYWDIRAEASVSILFLGFTRECLRIVPRITARRDWRKWSIFRERALDGQARFDGKWKADCSRKSLRATGLLYGGGKVKRKRTRQKDEEEDEKRTKRKPDRGLSRIRTVFRIVSGIWRANRTCGQVWTSLKMVLVFAVCSRGGRQSRPTSRR